VIKTELVLELMKEAGLGADGHMNLPTELKRLKDHYMGSPSVGSLTFKDFSTTST